MEGDVREYVLVIFLTFSFPKHTTTMLRYRKTRDKR
jgi:hypothetical protein